MPFTITQAKLIVAYVTPNANANDIEPGEVETAWRTAFPAQAADLDDACALLLSMPVFQVPTVKEATRQAMIQIDLRLAITGAGLATASAVDPSTAAYNPGSGGSHGGSAWLLERANAGQWQHTVTVKVAGVNTNVTACPSVYVRAV